MKITAVQCNVCGDIIWSRAQHDFHYCSCGSVAIDGGMTGYVRILGNNEDYEMYDLELDISEKEAYDDWNTRKNKLGTIHTEESTKFMKDL